MRLKKSKSSAEEELVSLLNEGYNLVHHIQDDYHQKSQQNIFNPEIDIPNYRDRLGDWAIKVAESLEGIFPTELEANVFWYAPESPSYSYRGQNSDVGNMLNRLRSVILPTLKSIIDNDLSKHTDLPINTRLYIEDIDSFRKVRDINPSMVQHLMKDGNYLDKQEDVIQLGLEKILDVNLHKKDWGGETNDLYTANLVINGSRTATAFLLKGNGLKRRSMEIRDCGKNGDQILRLCDSPAELFVIQFVGGISESVIKDIEGKVNQLRLQSKKAYYCILDGQDTARLLYAYGLIS